MNKEYNYIIQDANTKRSNPKESIQMKQYQKRKRKLMRRMVFISMILSLGILWVLFHKISEWDLLDLDQSFNKGIEVITNEFISEPREYSNPEIEEKLRELARSSKDYREIYEEIDEYPEELLAALCNNSEMLEFVQGYLEADPDETGEFTKKEMKGEFPLLLQWDTRWGYSEFGGKCLGLTGCAPTCLSMVVLSLTGNEDATPNVVASYAEREGYYVEDTGTSWSFMTDGAQHFGINGSELSLNENTIFNELQSGHPIICSMRPGDFTTVGHFIVLVGVEDDKIIVNDPNSRSRSSVLWEYDNLANQIKNLWVYTK